MKHLTFADKSLLVDDDTADALLEYTKLLAQREDADSVTVNAVSGEGQDVEATLLLDAGAPLMIETTQSSLTPPDNADVLMYLQERIMLLSSPPPVQPENDRMPEHFDDLDLG